MLRSGLRAHLCLPVCFMPCCCCPSFSVPSAPHRKTGQQPPWAIVRAHVTSPSMHFPKLGPPVAVDASCYPNGHALYTQHTTPVASSFKAIGAFHNRAANAFLVVVHSVAFVHTLGTITSFQRPSREAPSPKNGIRHGVYCQVSRVGWWWARVAQCQGTLKFHTAHLRGSPWTARSATQSKTLTWCV